MKRVISLLLTLLMLAACLTGCGNETNQKTPDAPNNSSSANDPATTPDAPSDELEGEITFWHSFTQGPRLETIQAAADAFMKDPSQGQDQY